MPSEPLRVWIGDPSTSDLAAADARSLNPIVRAHVQALPGGDDGRSLIRRYRVTDLADAEVAALPRRWSDRDPDEATAQVRRAEAAGLRTLVFAGGDIEPLLPSASMILLHAGPTRGAQPVASSLAVPFLCSDRARFLTDPGPTDRPTVAFCGQGVHRPGAGPYQAARRAVATVQNRVTPAVVTPPLRGHVRLRARAIRSLQRDERVDDRFVIRNRYRAGAPVGPERDRTQAEFDDNLRAATYALCIRGAGNFSARFYEALSFGRVPLFVDTRCVLPLEGDIDWRRHCVWVDQADIATIGDAVVQDHRQQNREPVRTPADQRRLWEDHLTEDGFYGHLVDVVRRLL